MSGLVLERLQIGYGPQCLLHEASAELPESRLTCLLGPNGVGKSSLLRTLCGMQAAQAGQVLLAGRNVATMPARERARQLAVVLTDRILAGALSVRELVALGRQPHTGWRGRLSNEDETIIEDALTATDAQSLAERDLSDLSDGERQRAMLARALAQSPQVLVLDETLAFLDLPRRVQTIALLRQLAKERNIAVILSCHDLELALRWSDHLWVLPGDTRLCQGAPEDLALDGTLETAFSGEGLHFDLEAGGFTLPPIPSGRSLRILGEGARVRWLMRAMQRMNWMPDDAATDAVEVLDTGWRWQSASGQRDFSSLGEMIKAMSA